LYGKALSGDAGHGMFAQVFSAAVPVRENLTAFFVADRNYEVDFADVKGRYHGRRAIEVAVADGHNLLIM